MNRTLKIFLIVGLTGLLLIALAAVAFFKFVSDHKDDWLSKGRDALQEGVEAGKGLDDRQCLDAVFARHRDGNDGFAGLGGRLWFKGCLQSAAPTEAFCGGVPATDDLVASVRWQMTTCAKQGLSQDSSCGGTVSEMQHHCQARASAP